MKANFPTSSAVRMRTLLALTLICPFLLQSHADAQSMTFKETKGVEISGQWRSQSGLVTKGPDGKVIFLYGEVQPSVIWGRLREGAESYAKVSAIGIRR